MKYLKGAFFAGTQGLTEKDMRIKKFILSSMILAGLNTMAPMAQAGDGTSLAQPPPALQQKHILPGAIRLQITPRGMKYFETRLTELLANMGVGLDQGFFPAISWTAEKSYRLDDVNMPAEQKQMLSMVSNMLTKWLIGFSFQEFRPSVQISQSGYTAEFERFALVTDEALLRALGKTDGAVLAIELEIKNLTLAAASVRASDQNNKFLGDVGVDSLALRLATGKTPLKVRLPFYVRIDPRSGQLEFQAVNMTNNLDQVDMSLSYKKLVVPQIILEVNGHRYEMNQKELEKELQQNLPEILTRLRAFLADFATRQLPQTLNEEAKKVMTGSLEEINRMTPPGADDNSVDAKNPLLWGLKVSSINLRQSLQLGLNAYIEDPLRPTTNTLPFLGARGLPNLNVVPADSYDLALAIDRGFINRALQLSFNRGIFRQIPLESGLMLRLTQIPTLDYVNPVTVPNYGHVPGEISTLLRMKTRILIPKGMLKDFAEKMAIKQPFEVSLDVIGKMIKTSTGDLKILYWDVDPASVSIDDKYLSFIGSIFRSKVQKGLRDRLAQMASEWRQSGKVLAESFPVPQEILGIKLDTQKLAVDPNGYILFYMNYALPHTGGTL
jgi:hypothetical protein